MTAGMVGLLDKDFKAAMITTPQQVTEARWKQGVESLSDEEIIQKKQKLRMKRPWLEPGRWLTGSSPFPTSVRTRIQIPQQPTKFLVGMVMYL